MSTMPAPFVHLRLHTAYSLAESTLRIGELVRLVSADLQPAAAITDTNNMFGALEFAQSMAGAGVQPIMGAQVVLEDAAGSGDVVLLAQTQRGYVNLSQLLSKVLLSTDGVHTPSCKFDDLACYAEGLILLSGGALGGFVGAPAGDGRAALARQRLAALASMMPGQLYVELQRHGLAVELAAEPHLLACVDDLNLPLVATNDCRFEDLSMSQPHDTLVCIGTGRKISEQDRPRYSSNHYFKTASQMIELFADIPEAIENTLVIAKRCSVMAETRAPILPAFSTAAGRNEAEELTAQAEAGLQARLQRHIFADDMDDAACKAAAQPYLDRLKFELDVIQQMGFPGYFLIVADFIQWAKAQNIPVGPGRGSGAGSVVAWALSITDLDPLKWGLLFERFLNPERVSMPDFDIDFCQDRRDEVISYVQSKYGHDRVAQIITFGSLQARAALRDVGRVLEMPYGQVDRIAKLIPNNPANPTTISEALKSEPELRAQKQQDEQVADLITVSMKLEGLYRHASTHAAGLVIGDRPLAELVPLYRDPRSDMPVTQFNMKWVEKAGLVKFDFLGLKTLTVLQRAVDFLAHRGIKIDLADIPLDDAATYQMLSQGDTVGVFQLESSGMRDVLRGLRPDRFEDIIAVVALYRPGPMDNIPRYISCKHGEEDPDYLHPLLEEILTETYGVIIYQEQVMQIAQILADYSLGDADLLRRAMGKKIASEMDKQRARFQDGADKKGVDPKQAAGIFDQVAKFAGYGFNKSHAAAYALVSYHTAFLKANYAVEFMAAIMTLDLTNTDKLHIFKQELTNLDIPILPPDINKSQVEFTAEVIEGEKDEECVGGAMSDGKLRGVRYALAGLKNVGAAAMESLIEERSKNGDFKDMDDFCSRVDTRQINKRALENLIKAGAFDTINPNRAQLLQGVEMMLREMNLAAQERNSNQVSLFGDQVEEHTIILPEVNDWDLIEKLKCEKEAVGFYLSAHPLDAYTTVLARQKVIPSTEIAERASGKGGVVKLAGTIQGIRKMKSKRGKAYAFLSLSDAFGGFEVTLFSELLESADEILESGNSVIINAEVRHSDDGASRITAQGIETIDSAAQRTGTGLDIYVRDASNLEAIKEILSNHQNGRGRVTFKVSVKHEDFADCDVDLELKERYKISPAIRNAVASLKGVIEAKEI